MRDPAALREEARSYLRACRSASDRTMKEHYAVCAFELAQMAEALERTELDKAGIDQTGKVA